ncbi:GNAT family N-acetyltransferase [Fusibacter paucivorans]|uniref:GNAT family N-acetyltransferase n=1 Tax=Fusibacter paucivorans TaxID=76009 RepID=A0ABS5PK86_9FIRM|nr:GNAT family N-acetyltransferase [Fusibacter paucivorans]MBS7525508.1 GNAT family N-acetyltransferase [Fusibacter paucivorans]
MFGKLEASDLAKIKAYMAANAVETIYLEYPVAQFEQGKLQGVLYGYISEQSLVGLFYFSNKRSLIMHYSDPVVLGNLNVLKAFKHHAPKYVKGETKQMNGFYNIICRTVENVQESKSLLMTYRQQTISITAACAYATATMDTAETRQMIQDLKFFLRVEQYFGRNIKSIQDIQKSVDNYLAENQFCLMHDGEKLIAQGLIEEETEQMGIIGGIYVDPAYRRRQIGRFISETLTKRLLENGKRPNLFVLEKNAPAIALYHKIGYEDVSAFSVFTIDY